MNHPDYCKKSFFKKIPTFFSAPKTKIFSLYVFWSCQHLATPTHPPLWWHNTWIVPNSNLTCQKKTSFRMNLINCVIYLLSEWSKQNMQWSFHPLCEHTTFAYLFFGTRYVPFTFKLCWQWRRGCNRSHQ